MKEKEIAEIRRRFRPEKNNIAHIRGCCVNEKGEIVSEFNQSLALMPQEEAEKMLATLRRTLAGTPGKNLLDITFTTQQVADSEEHKLLMALRSSALGDEEAIHAFFEQVMRTVTLEGNYLILLAHDTYDVPYRSKDGERLEDSSTEVFSYILCSICPVKLTKPALSYSVYENEFHNRQIDWLVAPPELGFLFPAFDDRSANLYNALYYTRNTAENQEAFIDAIFKSEIPMPAAAQKETFQALFADTLAEDCSYDLVQAVHDQLCEMIEVSKSDKEADPILVSKLDMKRVLESCGVEDEKVTAFAEKYDAEFGADAELQPRNIVDDKQFEVCTPDVTIRVNPQRSELVETRVIDGKRYILIRAEEGVEVNGVSIHIP